MSAAANKLRRHERAEAVRADLARRADALEAIAGRYAYLLAWPDDTLQAAEREAIVERITQHRRHAACLREAMSWPD